MIYPETCFVDHITDELDEEITGTEFETTFLDSIYEVMLEEIEHSLQVGHDNKYFITEPLQWAQLLRRMITWILIFFAGIFAMAGISDLAVPWIVVILALISTSLFFLIILLTGKKWSAKWQWRWYEWDRREQEAKRVSQDKRLLILVKKAFQFKYIGNL